ncbi:hypothetical protein [Caldalkalibacillus salinus]|uniref:hypothetical protein n=1 Tax=Caldalkalibacillus salinus TaxID=2803787 RepID=UPI001924FA4E|nr:hypothetical protein [Caldalkalibacillus salinus]
MEVTLTLQHLNLNDILPSLSPEVCQTILREIQYAQLNDHVAAKNMETSHTTPADPTRKLLQDTLIRRDVLQTLYNQLSEVEKQVLYYFMFQVGQDFLTHRQIEHEKTGHKSAYFRLGLTGLRRKGIIYTLRRQWGEEAYVLPLDLESSLYDIYLAQVSVNPDAFSDDGVQGATPPVVQEERTSPPLYKDILYLLDEWRREAHIPLTQKGSIHKRYIRQWQTTMTDMAARDLTFELFQLQGQVEGEYSPALALLLDFMTQTGLLNWHATHISYDQQRAKTLLHRGARDMQMAFLSYWQHGFKPQTAWLERYQKDLLQHLRTDEQGEWVALLDFVERWEDQYEIPHIQDMQDKLLALIDPLVKTGCLVSGVTDTGEHVWRNQRWEDAPTTLWIQPDLELFCAGDSQLGDIWLLTAFCDIVQWDQMLVLTLSEDKVLRDIERGGRPQEWLDQIAQLSHTPVPDAFKDQLQQWKKKKQQVVVQNVALIRIEDTTLRKAMKQWALEADIPVQDVGAQYLSVPIEHEERVLELLQEKQVSVLHKDQGHQHEDQAQVSPALRLTPRQHETMKVESTVPEWTDAIPAWKQLPQMWTKQFTQYHEKTKREMVEKAVEHQLWLNVEMSQSTPEQIVPKRCFLDHGEWVIEDDQRRQHALSNIKKMQLVFPVWPQS